MTIVSAAQTGKTFLVGCMRSRIFVCGREMQQGFRRGLAVTGSGEVHQGDIHHDRDDRKYRDDQVIDTLR